MVIYVIKVHLNLLVNNVKIKCCYGSYELTDVHYFNVILTSSMRSDNGIHLLCTVFHLS